MNGIVCLYRFKDNNLALLITIYMQVIIVLVGDNLVLQETNGGAITIWMKRQLVEHDKVFSLDISIGF